MPILSKIVKKNFQFNFDARTSRGRMKEKTSWFVLLWDSGNPHCVGIGECGPLPGLSPDDRDDFEEKLQGFVELVEKHGADPAMIGSYVPPEFPSIRFGLETALLDLINGGKRLIYDNSFVQGKSIPINGLVWMGDLDLMLQQVSLKILKGFRCVKIKVGGLNFEKECDILHYIRSKYFREEIIIRLDANGAFKTDEALYKLNELSRFNIHSIEQPLAPGQTELEELCRNSPIPVALDEELIGAYSREEKEKLLDRIKPQFIILKPSIHGGFQGTNEWIELADDRGVGWWITSALESNIGLNAICQFTSNFPVTLHQGLGTGQLYDNNFESPLTVDKGEIAYRSKKEWQLDELISAI